MKPNITSGLKAKRRSQIDGRTLWVLLLIGLALMVFAAAAARGEGAQAKRTETFNATLSPGSTLRIENVWGDVLAAAGRNFSASVTIVVTALSRAKADELARSTIVKQSRQDADYILRTVWPHSVQRHGELRCQDCKITARYEVTVPPGVRAVLHTVNGEIHAEGLDGELDLQSVNGGIAVRGARQSVMAHSVNGKVDVSAQGLPKAASFDLKTVNGGILLTLPKDANFELSASSMSGSILSTFPLPARVEADTAPLVAPRAPATPRPPRAPRPTVVEADEEEMTVDLRQLEKELEQSMREVEIEVRESLKGMDREMRHLKFLSGGQYKGSIGQGGARVQLATLNGAIHVLASGTKESEAKPLVSPRRSLSVEIPRIEVRAPRVSVHPRAMVRVAPKIAGDEDEVARGDVAGDFLGTTGGGSYRIGKVSGRVKIVTQAGEIHVASAGAGAELKTQGGDISIGSVSGDLEAQTGAGDVRAGVVSGAAAIETTGGDVRIESVGGAADVRTGGGDIVLRAVSGAVQAHTGGGDVRIVLLSRDPRGGVSILNAGGDVTLTLPSDARATVELEASDSGDAGEASIRSDFPEVAVSRRSDSTKGAGAINGGGPRVTVRTRSGAIRIRKGPPAGG